MGRAPLRASGAIAFNRDGGLYLAPQLTIRDLLWLLFAGGLPPNDPLGKAPPEMMN